MLSRKFYATIRAGFMVWAEPSSEVVCRRE
jgi:hypothetical protein